VGTAVLGHGANRILRTGFSIVYDCIGSSHTLHDALRWVRPGGTVLLIGVNMFPGVLDRTPLWHRNVTIAGVLGYGLDRFEGCACTTFDRAIEWVATGRLSLEGLLTHRFALQDFHRAIETAANKAKYRAIKVAFAFDAP
jgi:threonine dehydrogenase-like Zn-dependent dehydrogenase